MRLSKGQRELILRAEVREGEFYPKTNKEVAIVAELEGKGLLMDRTWKSGAHVRVKGNYKLVRCKALTRAGIEYVAGELLGKGEGDEESNEIRA